LDKGVLQWMQGVVACQTFDGDNVTIFILQGECQTGIDTLAVDQHRTGALDVFLQSLRKTTMGVHDALQLNGQR
jgi:hypothetical protein